MDPEPKPRAARFGRISAPGTRPDASRRGTRLVRALSLLAGLGLTVSLILSLVPLRAAIVQDQRVTSYSVTVPSLGFGTEPINRGFLDLCDAGTSVLSLTGNQTVWLAWQVVRGAEPAYAELVASLGTTPTVLYNASGVAQGGFAQTSSSELRYLCGGSNPLFSAYSNSSSTILLQVGLVYERTVTVSLL